MQFDTADLTDLEMSGGLDDVILHEMGHVVGIGGLWREFNLVRNFFTANPTYIGPSGMREFATLIGSDTPVPVPVATSGRAGSHGVHFRESVFGNALMTPNANMGTLPLTRLAIASLEDIGFEVNFEAPDDFTLPAFRDLAIMGVGAGEEVQWQCSCANSTDPVVLPEEALRD